MTDPRPSPAVLRRLTDETVLRALAAGAPATRAELAERTRLSKPAVAQSVSRLVERGLAADTGERTTGRGGVGTYYALAPDAGVALALVLAPEGLVAELVGPDGVPLGRAARPVPPSPTREDLARELAALVTDARAGRPPGAVRVTAVSAAGPVDRRTARIVRLPDDPFIGELDPTATIAPLVGGRVVVDNDVNWAARAERSARRASDPAAPADDFAYLYLGAGLGCAVVSDGEVRRGRAGLAGEISHVLTTDGTGPALPLTAVFEALGVHRPGTSAIDVDRLVALLRAGDRARTRVARAVAGVVSAVTGLLDPQFVVLGGPWGALVLDEVGPLVDASPRPVPVVAPLLTDEPALRGVRAAASALLVDDLVGRARA